MIDVWLIRYAVALIVHFLNPRHAEFVKKKEKKRRENDI